MLLGMGAMQHLSGNCGIAADIGGGYDTTFAIVELLCSQGLPFLFEFPEFVGRLGLFLAALIRRQ
eukprot:scaffold534056_cov34-Prasinocladus_malaysianus.AAC.1